MPGVILHVSLWVACDKLGWLLFIFSVHLNNMFMLYNLKSELKVTRSPDI